jgi:hypothetical protein
MALTGCGPSIKAMRLLASNHTRRTPRLSSLEAVADYVQQLTGDLDHFIAHLDQSIRRSSATATYGGGIDQTIGDARQVVRVYERYSAFGGNRVSLNISVLAVGEQLAVSAISSGGSQAVWFKINTVGEDSFLKKAVDAIRSYQS